MKVNEMVNEVRNIRNDRISLIEQEVWEEYHREGWTLEEMQEEIDLRVECEADEESILLELMFTRIRELCEHCAQTDARIGVSNPRTAKQWAELFLFDSDSHK